MDYNHHDNRAISLYDTLKNSYKPLKEQSAYYKQHGYKLDTKLSNDNQQVFYNPRENKLLFSVAGTHNLKDWGTDAYLAVGKLKDTSRYKEADRALKEAKAHYKPKDVSIAGHSLGGTISSYIAQPSDKVYTLDKGVNLGQGYRNNEKAFRTSGDVISILGSLNKNMKTLPNHNIIKDPYGSHDIEQIKDLDVFV